MILLNNIKNKNTCIQPINHPQSELCAYKHFIALVTGSSKGIGQTVVKALLDEGCLVAGWSRSKSAIDNDRFLQLKTDVTEPD